MYSMPKSLFIPPRNEMQMTSSQTLLFPLQLIVPGVESVASCLVDGMLFIILQVRSEQTAAYFSLVVMIRKTNHMTTLNTVMSRFRLKFLWILSYPPKLAKMEC